MLEGEYNVLFEVLRAGIFFSQKKSISNIFFTGMVPVILDCPH